VFDSAHVHHGVMDWTPRVQKPFDMGRMSGRAAWVWFTQQATADWVHKQKKVQDVMAAAAKAARTRAAQVKKNRDIPACVPKENPMIKNHRPLKALHNSKKTNKAIHST
jgi:hypothetical protein